MKDLPLPKTWVFYDIYEAIGFLKTIELPIVFKTNIGASSSGVRILRKRSEAVNLVKKAFKKGIVIRRGSPLDRQWGSVILQEYLPDVIEWRMVRIGNSFFGHKKEKIGDFHSGSRKVSWDAPSRSLLDLLRKVTEIGGFASMNVDIFQTQDNRLLVNELQTVFGASISVDQLRINGKPGRYLYNRQNNDWVFEEGDFARNACANARVEYVTNTILPDGRR
jgi:glutathione synthase/RimK-type ligase-like ATP-grasp enzyme